MPELPEVETVVRTLAPEIVGSDIVAVKVLNAATRQGKLPLSKAVGRTVQSVRRRGKLILFEFAPMEGDESGIMGFAVHLRMTGRLFIYPHEQDPEPHTRVIFDLSNGSRLFFDDARKFGVIRMMTPKELASWPFWQKLGPDPLEISSEDFAARLQGKGSAVKAVLLDQSVIAGIGNIYADESLFRAGIAPQQKASSLSVERLKKLHTVLVEVLKESIADCGSSIKDYRTAKGDSGAFQNKFRVYGRGGEKCLSCGKKLLKDRVAGRGTVWCPFCQKKS